MSNGVVRAIEVVFASDRSMNRKIAPDRSPHLAHPVGSRHADSLTAHQVNSSPSLWSFKCRSFPAVSGGPTLHGRCAASINLYSDTLNRRDPSVTTVTLFSI